MEIRIRPLTEQEQLQFRGDFQDKEREINRYIAVYLSALAVVTGWILGPQSKAALDLFLGNNGYNLFGWFLILFINIIFSCFLTYKSIIIHEVMQFVTYLSPRDSGFQYWESWRRSPQSATKRVRAVYTAMISAVPIIVAMIILTLLGVLLLTPPQELTNWVNAVHRSSTPSPESIADPVQLARAVSLAKWAWLVIFALHSVPVWFFYENVLPIGQRWKRLAELRPEVPTFEELVKDPFTAAGVSNNGSAPTQEN